MWTAVLAAILIVCLVGLESIPALAIMLLDGSVALAVLASAGLAGGWVGRWLGMKDEPWAERLTLGAGLGIGLLSLAVLGLGSLGWLTRTMAFLLVGGTAAAGLLRLALDLHEMGLFKLREGPDGKAKASNRTALPSGTTESSLSQESSLSWLWLLVCPFVAIMLLAACLPPGVLWREEGFGYDVLEYHLAVPKIFFEQGRITFLPNNIYSNFPLNSEMLSLLMMELRGDPIESAFMAVFVNVGMAGLFAAGAWLAGRRFSARAGTLAGVLALTTPWIGYLAGIAYVEVGMLALGMCALAAALKSGSGLLPSEKVSESKGVPGVFTDTEKKRLPTPFSAGLLAGLACGFKYTAVPLIALPVSFALLAGERAWPRRVRGVLVFGCGAMIAFGPWLIRNAVNTGNPFYPLAYSVFGDRSGAWNDELHARWQRVHGTAASEHTDESLAVRAWARTGGDFRLGAATFLLAAIGAIRRRDRWTAALLAMLIVQIAIWLTATHLFARFAVVTLLPALVLAGRALETSTASKRGKGEDKPRPLRRGFPLVTEGNPPRVDRGTPTRPSAKEPDREVRLTPVGVNDYRPGRPAITWALIGLLVAGTGWNLYRLGQLYYAHTRIGGTRINAYGHTDWFTSGQWIGTQHWGAINALPADARVMLVGEARTFYLRRPCDYAVVFNRNPLAEAVERLKDPVAVMNWLRQRGTTHLLVHWGEIGRLSATYGFPPALRNPFLYRGLVAAGLKETADFTYPNDPEPYATLFEVSPACATSSTSESAP